MSGYEDIDRITQIRATTFSFSEAETERILFPQTAASFPIRASQDCYSTTLEHLRKKETRYFLHGTVLSQYWRNSRIPRGLRINKEPTLGRDNVDFCKKWCAILNRASLDLMLLVIENENDKLDKIRTEIASLHEEIAEKLSHDTVKDMVADCDLKIATYRK